MPHFNFLGILLLILLFVTSDHGRAVAGPSLDERALFAPRSPEDTGWIETAKVAAKKEKTVIQIDFVRLRTDVLFQQALNPGLAHQPIRPVVLNLPPNFPQMTVVTTTVERNALGYLEWTGYIEGDPKGLVVLMVKEGSDAMQRDAALAGTIVASSRTFHLRPDKHGTHAIIETDTSKFPPEGPSHPRKRLPKLASSHTVERLFDPHIPLSAGVFEPPPLLPTCTIDVLVVYTPDAEGAQCMQCDSEISKDISNAIKNANTSYQASGINLQLNLVNQPNVSYKTCVTENSKTSCYMEQQTDDLQVHLDNIIKAENSAISTIPLAPSDRAYPLKVVSQWKYSLNADLVAFWLKGPTDASGDLTECGLSYGVDEDPVGTITPDPNEAYVAVPRSCAYMQYSMAHEFGHLGGAHHDRGSLSIEVPGDVQDDHYSYGYVLPRLSSTSQQHMSIMAVTTNGQTCPNTHGVLCCTANCTRMPGFWSTPDKMQVEGPAGIPDLASPPALESSADNRRMLNTSAEYLANYRWPHVMPGVCQGTVNPPPVAPANLRVR